MCRNSYICSNKNGINRKHGRSFLFLSSIDDDAFFIYSGEKGEDPSSSRACYVGHLVLLPYT